MRKLLSLIVLASLAGCARQPKPVASPQQPAGPAVWGVSLPERIVEHFGVPECVVVDPATGRAYISNVETADQGYWVDDGVGSITRMDPAGSVDRIRWRDSTATYPMNAPKGMCILKGVLYVADNTRVLRFPLNNTVPMPVIAIPGAQKLNDMATDGKNAYVSDTGTGAIYRIDGQAAVRIAEVPSVNGITFADGRMFAVSWDKHDVYEIERTDKVRVQEFGVDMHFKSLDGIEVLEDGTFLVSDFVGGQICTIAPDRKTVRTLVKLRTPADFGLDRGRSLLYVPQLEPNRIAIYRLTRRQAKK